MSGKYPPFGRSMRKEFLFDQDYVNLNHGAFGTYPKVVQNSLRSFQDRSEANADLWMRRELKPEMVNVRSQIASLVNADLDDIVMITNDTTGINAIFRSIDFKPGDRILHLNTIYFAMDKLVRFICDSHGGEVTSLCFNITYPMTNDAMLEALENFLHQNFDPHRPIRIAIVDHITSAPGVVQPIERLVQLLRKNGILSMVDAAHAVGQVPIDLKVIDPDFYTSNCHKWLYAARPCAFMYVKKEHQSRVHPVITSCFYEKTAKFPDEFFWIGTIDYSAYMTVTAALEFRRDIGGEEAIREYTHRLAWEGGHYLAREFGTEVLQIEEEQVGNMVDVRLPLNNPEDEKFNGDYFTNFVSEMLFDKYKVYSTSYKHSGKWWIRVSAQIYNDMEDFKEEASAFLHLCREINAGKL